MSILLFSRLFTISILLFSRLFVYLLLTILSLYLTKSHICWSCTKHRKKLISCIVVDQIVLSYPMRRKTERKKFFQYMPNLTTNLKIFFTYITQLMKLKLLGQSGYLSSSTTCFINCLNITFMRVFKKLIKYIEKKQSDRICFNCCFLRYFQ